MSDKKYIKLYDNGLNSIYCRDIKDVEIFIQKYRKVKETIISYDTMHPLD